MGKWRGKYVIGLTGNIATGKSVVRKMLEHLGAYGIDADALSHRAIAKGAPGYQPVVDAFGKWILSPSGEIDREKLGRLVFSDPEALERLENIVHPLVQQAVDLIARRATQQVIIIEAIKLLEGKLVTMCDTVWVTYVPASVQKARLIEKRGMSEADAIQRIQSQGTQEAKTVAANVVIQNAGSFEDTWKQVVAAWKTISKVTDTTPVVVKQADAGSLYIQRGRPRDSAKIAELVTRLSGGTHPQTEEDIMAAFGEKAFLLLKSGENVIGLAGWQVENLVTRTMDFYLDPSAPLSDAIKIIMNDVESASHDLQSEASLLFLPPQMAAHEATWKELGYERRTPQTLGVQAWQDAALELMHPNTILLFKQLRQDRVLRPI